MSQKLSFLKGLSLALLNSLKNYFTKEKILDFLKKKVITFALKKLAKTWFAKEWLVAWIVKELFEEVVEPLVKIGLIEVGYAKDKIEGKITAKKIIEARRTGNAEEYHNTVNDMFGR